MKKGLPSKFAKMGFAKGWREYKKSKKSKSSGDDMARKRRRRRAAPARQRYNRRRSRNKKILGIPVNWILLGAGGVGIYYLFLNKNGATDTGGFW